MIKYSLVETFVVKTKNSPKMSTNISLSDEEQQQSMTKCRVCGSMIDIHNKKEQHIVKCEYCNEATVSKTTLDPYPFREQIHFAV